MRPGQVWSSDMTWVPMAYGLVSPLAVLEWWKRFALGRDLSSGSSPAEPCRPDAVGPRTSHRRLDGRGPDREDDLRDGTAKENTTLLEPIAEPQTRTLIPRFRRPKSGVHLNTRGSRGLDSRRPLEVHAGAANQFRYPARPLRPPLNPSPCTMHPRASIHLLMVCLAAPNRGDPLIATKDARWTTLGDQQKEFHVFGQRRDSGECKPTDLRITPKSAAKDVIVGSVGQASSCRHRSNASPLSSQD